MALMREIRVEVRSPSGYGDDALIGEIRAAIEQAALKRPAVERDELRDEIVASFEVDASGLEDAQTKGRAVFDRVIADAGITMPVEIIAATDQLP